MSPHARLPASRRTPLSPKTSWEHVADWYADYMARPNTLQSKIIFPGVTRLLQSQAGTHHLDVACGEGAFAAYLLKKVRLEITGIDAAGTLIEKANRRRLVRATFCVGDATHLADLFRSTRFDSASCILALQNIDPLAPVLQAVATVLAPQAAFVMVLNHPSFRQPRQSGWGWDDTRQLQYRRVDRYLGAYEMPIIAHPGSAPTVKTFSYHRPLATYVQCLHDAGFVVDAVEEWASNKTSTSGPRAKAENVARQEIPLFLALRARKT